MNLNDLSTQLLYTTVPIWTEMITGGSKSATAFIYNIPIPNKPGQSLPILITNYHVVEDAQRGLIEMILRKDDKPIPEKRVRVELSQSSLLQFTSKELDIAFLPLGGILNQLENSGNTAFFRSITPDLIPQPEVLSELAALEEIVFIGYPSGLRDETNSTPLIRRGITSTPVWNDFQGKQAFLIDAGVFPGSSGSPVFIFNQGAYATKSGLNIGSRLLFLGMISQSIVRTDSGRETFLGLGQVLRSTALKAYIDRMVEPLLQKA
jgi:hypothetical protein